MSTYKKDLVERFWKYQKQYFSDYQKYLERPFMPGGRPPVFLKHTANKNIITSPNISTSELKQLLNIIPYQERHRWFGSMSSSQAIAQSVFGNLKIYNRLTYLGELTDEAGESLLGGIGAASKNFSMEHAVDSLGEPRPTSIDAFFSGNYQIAIECKLTENDIGICSRPKLGEKNSNYEKDHCDGSYSFQKRRKERCSLTTRGVLYWQYIPQLFKYSNDTDYRPCPIYRNYQLVRNILAACMQPDGTFSPNKGHVVLIYDQRNPAFQKGGSGHIAFKETQNALLNPKLLRKCSWQDIVSHLKNKHDFSWLTEQLELKYGM